jgi:hypothetical protein
VLEETVRQEARDRRSGATDPDEGQDRGDG